MSCVIYRPATGCYVVFPNKWVSEANEATVFASQEKAQNYLTHNFAYIFKDIPLTEMEILDRSQLSPMQGIHTPETAAYTLSVVRESVERLEQQRSAFLALPSYYAELIRESDLETQDLLHRIEMSEDLGMEEAYDLFLQLRASRLKRRDAKDALTQTELLASTGIMDCTPGICEGLQKLDRSLDERRYRPRVLSELFAPEE